MPLERRYIAISHLRCFDHLDAGRMQGRASVPDL
jgi:hypothetical protein